MRSVANFFNCNVLNDVNVDEFYSSIPKLREICPDRAILRAIHFFDETKRNPLNQEIPLAIAMSKQILKGKGAVRVHGGGFAGTIQAFVPNELVKQYKTSIEEIFGKDSCLELNIRPVGGIEI